MECLQLTGAEMGWNVKFNKNIGGIYTGNRSAVGRQ